MARAGVFLSLLVPLAIVALLVQVVRGEPDSRAPAQTDADEARLVLNRPSRAVESQPPPTLAPPTHTPQAIDTPVPPPSDQSNPEAKTRRTYTVTPGDELRYIAAEHGVSIRRIIEINDIPNPDSLRVGQVLTIPDE